MDDKLIWKGTCSGTYQANQFCKDHINSPSQRQDSWKKVWKGMVPPKIGDILLAIIERENCCQRVISNERPIAQRQWMLYSLWRSFGIYQLFIFLFVTSLGKYGLIGVHYGVSYGHVLKGAGLFFSIGRRQSETSFVGQSKMAGHSSGVVSYNAKSNMVIVPSKQDRIRRVCSWVQPPSGVMKFNVDGSMVGKPGPAGIGGVLKDDKGNQKIVFSKSVGVTNSNEAEMLAVKHSL
ncbi:hypothetical protein DITRI_Ditri15bG0118000 [Diplodiscus trichospermus]